MRPPDLQAEQRAAIPDQIELDEAAAAVGLEITFALAIRGIPALREDWQVGLGKASPTAWVSAKQRSKPPSFKSSKKTPPTPRGSLRCFGGRNTRRTTPCTWIDRVTKRGERIAGRCGGIAASRWL